MCTQTHFRGLSSIVVALVGLAFCLGPGWTNAADPWESEPFSATAAQINEALKSAPELEDADVETLFEETEYRFSENGSAEFRRRHIYRILSDNGIDTWSEASAAWAPWYQERPTVEARVVNRDGTVHRLMPTEIVEAPVEQRPGIFSDRRQLLAPLPGTEVGSVVELLVQVKETRPFFSAGASYLLTFLQWNPARKVRLVVDIPDSLPFRFVTHGGGIQQVSDEKNGRKRLQWEVAPAPTIQDYEFLAPRNANQGAFVHFSTGETWNAVAEKYSEIVEEKLREASLADIAKAAVGEEKDRQKMILKLALMAQSQVRYTGLLFGDASIVPASPGETLRRRYGDCKDQSTLLVGLLRSVGISAYVALVDASLSHDAVEPELPGMGFNHAIVFVPGETPLWIDPTDRFLRLGELPMADQGRWALVIRPGEERLTRTPKSTSSDNGFTETRDYFLNDSGKTKVVETLVFRGSTEREMREHMLSVNDRQWRQETREYTMQIHLASSAAVKASNPRDSQIPLVIQTEIPDTGRAACATSDAVVHLFPGNIFDRFPYELRDFRPYDTTMDSKPAQRRRTRADVKKQRRRKYPLVSRSPHTAEYVWRIHFPPSFVPRSLPKDEKTQIGPALFEQKFKQLDEKTVSAEFRIDTGTGIFTPDDIEAWQNYLKQFQNHGSFGNWFVTLGFSHVGFEQERAGNWTEAFAIYRRELEANPEGIAEHLRLVEAYLRAGFVDASRQVARRAVDLAPEDPRARSALALSYSRPNHAIIAPSGESRAVSLVEYRKALELDPTNITCLQNMGILLEYNELGQRYAPDQLPEAIEHYRAVKDRLQPKFQDAFLLSLLHLDKYEEIRQMVAEYGDTPQRHAMLIAATLILDGLPAAVRETNKLPTAEERRYATMLAADYLNFTRKYAEATLLFEEVLKGSFPERARIQQFANITKQMQTVEKFQLPDSDPCHVVQKLLINALAGSELVARTADFFEANNETQTRTAHVMDSLVYDARKPLERVGRSPGRIADVAHVAKFVKEGDDQTGYRIDLTFLASKSTWWVVRRANGYKIIGCNVSDAAPAAEALRLLDENHLAASAQWMDWIWRERSNELKPFDILSGPPVLRLWRPSDEPNADSIRHAAYACIAQETGDPAIVASLVEAREMVKEADQLQIDRALHLALWRSKHFEESLAAVERVLAKHPNSDNYWSQKSELLLRLQRYDDAEALARERHDANKKDLLAVNALARVAAARGDMATANQWSREAVNLAKDNYVVLNAAAWDGLFVEHVEPSLYDDAVQAAKLSNYRMDHVLHTLATVCAELGKTDEALQYLQLATNVRIPARVEHYDWFVIGRIAEHHGLPDVARMYYERVKPTEEGELEGRSTHSLAQRRLKQLPAVIP